MRAIKHRGLILSLVVLIGLCGCLARNPRPGVYGPPEPEGAWVYGTSGSDSGAAGSAPAASEYRRVAKEAPEGFFAIDPDSAMKSPAGEAAVRAFSDSVDSDYRIGPGDTFAFLVRGRPDISREEVVVAPDGLVSLPRVGIYRIEGKTIPEATAFVREELAQYYETPDVILAMTHVHNNRVFLLGRVARPGAVHFSGKGTLLEALSLAGGLQYGSQSSPFLSRCMIVRGNDMLIWVDLRDLLEKGNLALNTRLQNGDFVFVPQPEDHVVYIMGEVLRPGVLVLEPGMTLLEAVLYAGGPTPNASTKKVFLVRSRGGKGHVEQVDLVKMYTRGDLRRNYELDDGDIVYVGRSGMGSFNAFISQLLPGMKAVDFSINTAESAGVMAELRKRIWGQEGFVSRTGE